jgi:signal peptidase I
MLPALANKHHVLVAPLGAFGGQLRRGDIVVFRHPVLPDRVYIKRIIGLPNEDVHLEGKQVWVDGFHLEEPYLGRGTICRASTTRRREQIHEWWLGPDDYFLMSDNRHEGQDDSRAFGPVHEGLILGRVWFRYWPVGSWGPIPARSSRTR